jgi:hypothetical protein
LPWLVTRADEVIESSGATFAGRRFTHFDAMQHVEQT